MKIYFATDHAGFAYKNELIESLRELGHEVEDCGAFEYDEHDDYPDFIRVAANGVVEDPENTRAIILGGSGQGEAMMANRFKGVRAAVYYGGPKEIVTLSRDHNNANVLSLGARFLTVAEAREVIELWLATPFSIKEHHGRRVAKLDQ